MIVAVPSEPSASMIEHVARALFLAEHPKSEWSAGRARVKWFFLAEAAIDAVAAHQVEAVEPTQLLPRLKPRDVRTK